ncbi:hypothetical protein [Mucilaginibacter sp. UYNi724]
MKRRLIADVAVLVEFPDALVVSGSGRDLAVSHKFFAGNCKRTVKTIALPLDKERRKQADMSCQYTVIFAHPFDQTTIGGQFYC